MSLKKEIIDLTKETLESSSIHAIPNITKSKFILIKIVWFIFFLISSTACAFFIYRSVTDYFNYDVVTNVKVKYQSEIKFPVVGICNLNIINSESTNDFLLKTVFRNQYPDMNGIDILRIIANSEFLNKTNKRYDIDPYDFIISCQYGGNKCDFDNDFEKYFDTQYGVCVKFNSGKNMKGSAFDQKTTYVSGYQNGLTLELYTKSADENDYFYTIENGFSLIISNQSDFDSSNTDNINISPGTSTKIMLSKNSWKKEPKPYSDCTNDLKSPDSYSSKTYKDSFSINKTYSFFDCRKVCLDGLVRSMCNCSIIIKQNSKYDICFANGPMINSQFKCISKVYPLFGSNPKYLEDCDCPIECEKTYFTHSVSVAEYPTLKYSNYLRNTSLIKSKYSNITYDKMKKSVSRIQIYFNEMKETVISEKIKTEMSDLVSNFGGTLGLFLGLSFLSLIEFVEIGLQILIVLFFKYNNSSKNSVKNAFF